MAKILKRAGIAAACIIAILIAAALALFWNEIRSLSSIKKLDDHPLVQMKYYGDYGFDKFLEIGAKRDSDLESFITKRLLRGLPIDLGVTDGWGCTVFVAKNEKGEVLFCRNYDFPYTPAMQVFTSPKNGFHSVSTVELDFLGYTKDSFPTGVNFASVFALGTGRFQLQVQHRHDCTTRYATFTPRNKRPCRNRNGTHSRSCSAPAFQEPVLWRLPHLARHTHLRPA